MKTITKEEFLALVRTGWKTTGYHRFYCFNRTRSCTCALGAAIVGLGGKSSDDLRRIIAVLPYGLWCNISAASDAARGKKAALAAIEALDWPEATP